MTKTIILTIVFLYLGCICCSVTLYDVGHCPVSSVIHGHGDGKPLRYNYPVDIYSPLCSNTTVSSCKLLDDKVKPVFFDCFSCERDQVGKHTCAYNVDVCPIDERNVALAIERQKAWISGPVLCGFKEALHTHVAKNIIVIGGSVTAGVASSGCEKSQICMKYGTIERCSWASRMDAWSSTLGSHVNTYNVAHPGYNSDTYKDKLREKLNQVGIPKDFKFSSSDIVFIDLSVNDANTFNTPSKLLILERGIEALIRNIHHMSHNHSMPAIILLEQWFLKHFDDYSSIYDKFARYYNLSVWSYADVVRSEYVQKNQTWYANDLLWKNNVFGGAHPPWHNHLYYADLLASIMIQQFDQCSGESDSNTSITTDGYVYPVIKSVDMLPPALYNESFHKCSEESEPLLMVSASGVAQLRSNGVVVALGRHENDMYLSSHIPVYESDPLQSWQVKEDRVGRYGFIHELDSNDSSHNNNHAHESKLIFRYNSSNAMKTFKVGKTILLQISYLRTYLNAGKVRVSLCNKPLKDGRYEPVVLDALWGDYKSFKFSLPEIFIYPIDDCSDSDGIGSIELIHERDDGRDDDERSVRSYQKFKLFDIKLCYMN